MRKLSLLPAIVLALSLVPACGGGGDDDDDDDAVSADAALADDTDAAVAADPDAAPIATTGLGQNCNAGATCPVEVPTCVVITAGDANGFCFLDCTVPGDPPTGSDPICAGAYSGPAGGQPRCIFVDNVDNPTAFTCGIVCTQPSDCPAGLTCMSLGGASACVGMN